MGGSGDWFTKRGVEWQGTATAFRFRPARSTFLIRVVLLTLNAVGLLGCASMLSFGIRWSRPDGVLILCSVMLLAGGVALLVWAVRTWGRGVVVDEIPRELVVDPAYCDVGVIAATEGEFRIVLRRGVDVVWRSRMLADRPVMEVAAWLAATHLGLGYWVLKPPQRGFGFSVTQSTAGEASTVTSNSPKPLAVLPVDPLEVLPVDPGDEVGERDRHPSGE